MREKEKKTKTKTKAKLLQDYDDLIKELDTPDRWVIFLHFTHDFDSELFLQTFESLAYNGFSGRIHVIDNSYNCVVANHPFVINHSLRVTTTLAQFTPGQVRLSSSHLISCLLYSPSNHLVSSRLMIISPPLIS